MLVMNSLAKAAAASFLGELLGLPCLYWVSDYCQEAAMRTYLMYRRFRLKYAHFLAFHQ